MERQIGTGASVQGEVARPAAFNPAKIRSVCIRYGGHDFIAAPVMAGAFLRRAQKLIDDGGAELVPLLHRDGIEFLYIDGEVPFSVHDASD